MFNQKASLYQDLNQDHNGRSAQSGGQYGGNATGSEAYNGTSYQAEESNQSNYNSSSSFDFYEENTSTKNSSRIGTLSSVKETHEGSSLSNSNSTRTKSSSSPKVTKTREATSGGLSREERTMLDLEAKSSPKARISKKPPTKTLEDEFWAQLEDEPSKTKPRK